MRKLLHLALVLLVAVPLRSQGVGGKAGIGGIAGFGGGSGSTPALALVNHTSASAAGASTVTTGAVSMSGANLLVVVARCFYDGANTCLVSDSSANTWVVGPNLIDNGSNIQISIAYVCVPTVTGSQTFTVTASGTRTDVAIFALGYSGALGTAGCNDGSGTTHLVGTSATCQPGSITPAGAGEVFVSGATGAANVSVSAFSINSSFTVEDSVTASAADGASADLIVAGAGAQNPTWTITGNASNTAYCVMVPFKP